MVSQQHHICAEEAVDHGIATHQNYLHDKLVFGINNVLIIITIYQNDTINSLVKLFITAIQLTSPDAALDP